MVTVQYERERGMRDVHQKAGGYSVNVSRTIAAPIERVFDAFTKPPHVTKGGSYHNAKGDRGTYRTVRRPDLLRFTWDNPRHSPGTIVGVWFNSRGPEKTVVTLQHEKLADRKAHEAMREGWSWALDSFRSYIETGKAMKHHDWLAGRSERPAAGKKAVLKKAVRARKAVRPRTRN